MRIGINTLFLIPGEVGGSETYLRECLCAVARDFPGEELILFTNRENDSLLRSDLEGHSQVRFVRLNFVASNRYARIVREQVELPFRARAAGVDLLWSPGYTAPVVRFYPQVTSILDMQYKSHPEDLTWMARLTTRLVVPLAAASSRIIIALSEFSKSEVVKQLGANPARVRVTHLAADVAFGMPLAEEDRRARIASCLGTHTPYLLAVSNSYPHKNLALAVEAFGSICGSIPHDLVVVGQRRLGEPALQRAIAALPEPLRVKRLDRVTRPDLVALYQGAAAFVFPSLYEGFGLPVLEAMTAGVPVIATANAAIPEVGGDAVLCFQADSRDDLAARIREVVAWAPAERERRVEKARQRASTFSWSRTAAQTVEALRACRGA